MPTPPPFYYSLHKGRTELDVSVMPDLSDRCAMFATARRQSEQFPGELVSVWRHSRSGDWPVIGYRDGRAVDVTRGTNGLAIERT